MKNRKIEEIYQIFKQYPKVCTDSRKLIENSIFIALKGDNFNGNSFAKEAISKGCKFAIVDEEQYCENDNYILVENTLKTLQALANYHRNQFNIPVIGITGSNGKTTTKELISAVLSKKYNITATKGNLNNHIGVPLTLLDINTNTEIAIIEMGANHIGEIGELCEIAQPNFGIITNIGKAHLEGFESQDGILKTKRALFDAVHKIGGVVFVNNNQPKLVEVAAEMQKITFAVDNKADYMFTANNSNFKVEIDWLQANKQQKGFKINSHLIGLYNADNLAAAITIGIHFNVPFDLIKQAIETYIPSNNRSQLIQTSKNTIILDAYNANPSSMKVALENFYQVNAINKVIILGDMLELGEWSRNEHETIVKQIEQYNFQSVYLVGSEFQNITTNESFMKFRNVEEIKLYFQENPLHNKTILIKGSRGIQLERVLDIL